MRVVIVIAVLLGVSPLLAAEPQVHRDLAYAEPKNVRQTLDVYASTEGKNHPVVVWFHGGSWRRGDKANVDGKPQVFTDHGFIFVAVNYRFVPQVTLKELMGDAAKSVHWVHDHIREYGGDPDSLFLMGHSAGAHISALLCTDERYLKAEGLSLANIKGCVPVDVGMYDVPKRVELFGKPLPEAHQEVFGTDEASQRDLSPVDHVAKGKHIPPFLIVHATNASSTKPQSEWFAEKLQAAGVPAAKFPGEGKDHGTINEALGQPDDPVCKAVLEFLDRVLKK